METVTVILIKKLVNIQVIKYMLNLKKKYEKLFITINNVCSYTMLLAKQRIIV